MIFPFVFLFQFTHPRGVRFDKIINVGDKRYSFNSRTREGCDDRHLRIVHFHPVSIHAPARGAITSITGIQTTVSFNSRTREGCDPSKLVRQAIPMFQFTHPRGVRSRLRAPGTVPPVSIHAPARGAIAPPDRGPTPRSFNSRTREGCDTN